MTQDLVFFSVENPGEDVWYYATWNGKQHGGWSCVEDLLEDLSQTALAEGELWKTVTYKNRIEAVNGPTRPVPAAG